MHHCSLLALLLVPALASAQYGTFSSAAVKAARPTTTIVVLDGGNTAYDRAITEAVKSNWKGTAGFEFVPVADLALRPITPEQTYLMKVVRVDPVKHAGTFLTLVQGWKMKKGTNLDHDGKAFTNVPTEQDLAALLIDPAVTNDPATAGIVALYIDHLQDYLRQVESGKITDKTTADRLYASRTRLVRDGDLLLARPHIEKNLTDATIQELYTAPLKLADMPALMNAVKQRDPGTTVSDVVITVGDHRNKHCFKRLFNAGTGELVYLGDDQALFGKKEGFIDTDVKNVQRAR
jgi:hypothetical protein